MKQQEISTRFAVIGTPIKHSLSALLHTAVFTELGLPWQTMLVDPKDTEGFSCLIKGIRSGEAGYAGANITIPYKEAVIEFCDELKAPATGCGAVNTLWRDSAGRLIGGNSDADGFLEALRLELKVDPADDVHSAVICGTGGAARAVASALASAGVGELVILSRTDHRALSFIESLRDQQETTLWRAGAYADLSRIIDPDERFDLCVNATPLGMSDDTVQEMPREWLDLVKRQGRRLFDVVYRRDGLTSLVQQARDWHIPATDGLTMLVEQAIISLKLWGVAAEPAELRAIMKRTLTDEGIQR
ncbi:MAG: shikimate dehydrogenase [Coriobacteriia bacterium]|nr:shikimate dehydrogenase [Coriobacteriia bacterium]